MGDDNSNKERIYYLLKVIIEKLLDIIDKIKLNKIIIYKKDLMIKEIYSSIIDDIMTI